MSTLSYGIDLLLRHSPIVSVPITQTTLVNSSNIIDNDRMMTYISTDYNNSMSFVTGYYPDLDKDPQVHRTLKKYYYYKLLDKWLYGDLKSLVAYVMVENGKAKLINSISDFNTNSINNLKEDDITLRIKFLESLISKDLVLNVLQRIVYKYGIHWYHLNKNEDIIKKKLETTLKEFLEGKIKKNN
jgi:hypothetical protein